MSPTVKRIAALAAVTAMGTAAAPVGSASAAIPPVPFPGAGFPGLPLTGFPAVIPDGFGSVGPVGEAGAVVGPVIITTAPSVFINTNNQVTAGGALIGAQVAGP
jgi:hypothetical protein